MADASASAAAVRVQLITNRTNATALSSGVVTILSFITRRKTNKNALPLHKFGQKLANGDVTKPHKGSAELYCLFIAAVSIGDAISFIRCIVLCYENKFSPNPAGFEIVEPVQP